MVDSQELNASYGEEIEVNSDEEMFPNAGTGMSQQQYELKDWDSQTVELFNSQTYENDATSVLISGDFTTPSQGFELPVEIKELDNLGPGQSIDLQVYHADMDCKPTSTTLDHLKQFPTLEVMNVPWVNFTVELPPEANDKPSRMFSEPLQKLFVKMGGTCTFNVSQAVSSDMDTKVRVMVVCSAPSDAHHPISRCDNHRCSDSQDIPDEIKTHVVRCKNDQAEYVGKSQGKVFEDRLAVIIPMGHSPKTGITLEFVCQNSCRNINRRATALVFTLEDAVGRILGRQIFQIKICTNIKRDKLNEENAAKVDTNRKRAAAQNFGDSRRGKKVMRFNSGDSCASQQQPPPVQIKEESGTGRRYEIDPVQIAITMPNRRMTKRVLEYCVGLISTAVLRTSSATERAQLTRYMQDIRRNKSTLGMPNSQSSVDSD